MAISLLWLVLSIVTMEILSPCCVRAQAPGDEDAFCLDISTAPAYAPSVKPLLDSWRYQNLLGDDGVWNTLDLDNDNIGWVSVPSSICQEEVKVTEPLSIPQNNWLFTQHISKSMNPSASYPVSVFLNVSYTFAADCQVVECHPFIQLYYYFSNSNNASQSMDPSNYSPLANLSLSSESLDYVMQFSTICFPIAAEDSSFYLGISDSGANVTIHRILVYRFIGPMMQMNLTILPETPAPIGHPINVTGTCAANSNTTSGDPPILTLDSDGTWIYAEDCTCIEGHQMDEVEGTPACVACSPGKYKPEMGTEECQPCPANSNSPKHGAAICTCLSSFYRSSDEGPEVGCTGPPSFPQQLSVPMVTSSSASISWNPPSDNGGRTDTFYNISHESQADGLVFPTQDKINVTFYDLVGLQPCTLYQVRVTAENGVSQQAGGQSQRSVATFFETTEGIPIITDVEVLDGVYIYWTPLTDDCVTISNYDIVFYVEEIDNSSIISVPSNKSIYLVNQTTDLPSSGQPIKVSVRGVSDEGQLGQWSDPVEFAKVNPNSPVLPTSSIPATTTETATPTGVIATVAVTTTDSSTGGTGTNPTTSPTSPSSGNGAVLSIVYVVCGAIGIIVLVAIGVAIFLLLRKFCRKYWKFLQKEETDYMKVQMIRYEGGEEGKLVFTDTSTEEKEDVEG